LLRAGRCRQHLVSGSRRTHDRNYVSFVPPINAEVFLIYGKYRQAFVQFAHSDEAQVRKIRIAISITLCEIENFGEVCPEVESEF
jgi:hypothetical protein